MENVVEQLLLELRRMQDKLLQDAFREHFGFPITDVKDTENLEHIIVQGEPISSFRYRGETFLYLQKIPDYKFKNDKVTFTILSKKMSKTEQKQISWTELTWQDINTLERIINNVHYEFRNGIGEKSFGDEVLNRFLETKDEGHSEKPNNLEEAAMNYIAPIENEDGLKVINFSGQDIKDAFIAGAKWQKEQMISALKNNGDLPIEFIDKFHEIDRTAFQNGQANMKEQMLKEAVEGTVMNFSSNQPRPQVDVYIDPNKYCTGDKVRIIIVKED